VELLPQSLERSLLKGLAFRRMRVDGPGDVFETRIHGLGSVRAVFDAERKEALQ